MGRARARVLTGALVLGPLLMTTPAPAGTHVADFGVASFDLSAMPPSSTPLLWDTVNKRIVPGYAANGTAIFFGDGSDGAFNNGPAQTGITVAGNAISIDTDVKAEFNFSSFNLSNGVTITARGSNPLTIRVLGNATIAGIINANGVNGANNSLTSGVTGGAGGAGGGAGGNSGFGTSVPGTAGTSGGSGRKTGAAATVALGGGSGANTDLGDGGGGGGGCNGRDSNGSDAGNGIGTGPGAAGACSALDTRTSLATNFESVFSGGAGGGGGSGYTVIQFASGAGGGGGGGAIRFVALGNISFGTSPSLGTIRARGGDGGNSSQSPDGGLVCGGGGGGGSGGAIWIQTAGTIGSPGNLGTINITRGNGGTDGGTCGGSGVWNADGGAGSIGIFRLDSADSAAPNLTILPGAPSATNVPTTLTANSSFVLISKPFDSGTHKTSYRTPTEVLDTTSSGCGTGGSLTVQYQGSNDGINYSGNVTKDQVSILNGFRYIRYQVSIDTGASTPPCLTGLSIPYRSTDFELKGGLACGKLRADRDGRDDRGERRGQGRNDDHSLLASLADFALLAASAGWLWFRPRRRGQYPATDTGTAL